MCKGPIQRTQITRNVQHSSMAHCLPHLLIWTRHVIEDTPAKTGEYPSDILVFKKSRGCLQNIFDR